MRLEIAIAVLLTTAILADCARCDDDTRSSDHSTEPAIADKVDMARWIDQLDAADFAVREQAEQALIAAGRVALPLLTEIAPSRTERGVRVTRIINTVRHHVTLNNATAATAGDVRAASLLPMWRRFRVAGATDVDRAKFLGQLSRAVASLELPEATPDTMFRLLSERDLDELSRDDAQYIALAALLYGGHPDTTLLERDGSLLRLLLSRGHVGTRLKRSEEAPMCRWLVRHFVENLPESGQAEAFQTLLVMRIPETATAARAVLRQSYSSRELAEAAAALAVSGKPHDLVLLEPLLDRSDLLRLPGLFGQNVQLSDVALLSCVLLTEQSPNDYGFQGVVKDPVRGFRMTSLRKRSLKVRRNALAAWEAWTRTQWNAEFPAPNPIQADVGQRF